MLEEIIFVCMKEWPKKLSNVRNVAQIKVKSETFPMIFKHCESQLYILIFFSYFVQSISKYVCNEQIDDLVPSD